MGVKREPITYKGRSFGIVILIGAQILIGIIHTIFGFLLLGSENLFLKATVAYDFYTIAFGLLIFVFAVFIWRGKKIGWSGTIVVSVFVSVADVLTLIGLPSIPGIPKLAAPTEIVYSVFVVFYLLLPHVKNKFT
jgi:hypothetical protein